MDKYIFNKKIERDFEMINYILENALLKIEIRKKYTIKNMLKYWFNIDQPWQK